MQGRDALRIQLQANTRGTCGALTQDTQCPDKPSPSTRERKQPQQRPRHRSFEAQARVEQQHQHAARTSIQPRDSQKNHTTTADATATTAHRRLDGQGFVETRARFKTHAEG